MLLLSNLLACADGADSSKIEEDSGVDTADTADTADTVDSADTTGTVDSGETGDTNTTPINDIPCEDRDFAGDIKLRADALESLIDGLADDCTVDWYVADLDARAECQGPWFEDTFVSWSPDGYTFDVSNATPIFQASAVLDAIIGPDGRYYLFYGEGDLQYGRDAAQNHTRWFGSHGLIGYGAINAAVSDDGVNFEVMTEFGIEGIVRGMVVDPDVLQMPDGTYRMYYVGTPVDALVQPGSWDDGVPHEAFYAESDDLISWRQVGMAVSGPNADPSVWCDGEGYCVMAATGLDWATSEDGGETWTFEYRQDPFGFAPEFHQLEDGRVRMFYNSKVKGGALDSAISDDGGRTFTEEGEVIPDNTVEAISLAPAPADIGGYYLYYHYWQSPYNGDYWGDHPCE